MNLNRPRRYLQYNDLVFDGMESINSSPSETTTTKYYSEPWLLQHGDYVASDEEPLLASHKLTLDLSIRTSNWDRNQVLSHVDFIKEQLVRRGKIWAMDSGGQIVYARAILDSYTPTNEWTFATDGYIQFSIELNLYEGLWHKADGNVTFLAPYNFCSFINTISNCFVNSDCDACDMPSHITEGYCEDCGLQCCDLNNAIPLCEAKGMAECDFFDQCSSGWRIVHNCELGRETAGDERLLGNAYCDLCVDGTYVFSFYADTVLKSTNNRITIQGSFSDPEISINGTKIKLNGVYKDTYISINSNGDILTFTDLFQLRCNEAKKVDYKNLTFCDDDWWEIQGGQNQVIVRGITSEQVCVYLDYERRTI